MTEYSDFLTELRAALGDGYEIERELTGSGMSRVFVASERALSRRVVVKVLPPELAAGVNRERFQREIQLAAQLQHPHIVPLHTAGARGDLLYFTMPFIEGESLRHALLEGVRFTPREVVRILHDVADALAYAHTRGVIHRDIKPGNVLRSGSHAVVTDFGVAKAISASLPAVGMTTSGMAIGTPSYMAPEQLAGDPAADHRVDLYAVGLLAYELLAGEAPFKASSPQETMAAQLTRTPESITRRRPDAPPALAALISRCLEKNPADRPQSAGELVAILDELEITSGAGAPVRSRTAVGGWVAAGAVAVALIVAGVHFSRQRPAPAPALAPDSTTVVPPAATLTRNDSLAIARAVQRKLAEQQASVRAQAESVQRSAPPPATPAAAATASSDLSQMVTRLADSLRNEIQRAVLDSVARHRGLPDAQAIVRQFGGAMPLPGPQFLEGSREGARGERPVRVEVFNSEGAASALSREAFAARLEHMGPPRRLFVSYPDRRGLSGPVVAASDSLADSVRRSLARLPRYVLVPEDSVRQLLSATRTISAIARTANVDLFVSVQASPHRDSSVTWIVTARDLGAHSAFGNRVVSARAPAGALLTGADSIVAQVARHLEQMDRAPRRQATAPAPPPPPVPHER